MPWRAATALANEIVSRLLWVIWQGALLPVAYALAAIGIRWVRSFISTPAHPRHLVYPHSSRLKKDQLMTRTKLSLLIPLLGSVSVQTWAEDTEQQPGTLNMQATVVSATRSEASICLLYTSPSPRDGLLSRMPSSA